MNITKAKLFVENAFLSSLLKNYINFIDLSQ